MNHVCFKMVITFYYFVEYHFLLFCRISTYSSEMERIPAPKQNAVNKRTAVEKLKKMKINKKKFIDMAPGLDRRAEWRAPKWLFTRAPEILDNLFDVNKVRLDWVTVAQMAQQVPRDLRVVGSIPASGSYETVTISVRNSPYTHNIKVGVRWSVSRKNSLNSV